MANIVGLIPHTYTEDESNQLVSLDTPEDIIHIYARPNGGINNELLFSMIETMNGTDNQPFFHVIVERQYIDDIESEETGNFYIVSEENREDFPSWGKDSEGQFLVL